jgi:hypothetical protein
MIKQTLFFSLFIIVVAIYAPINSFSQSTSGGTGIVSPNAQPPSGGSETPDVLQGQPDFPDYIVAPRDNLNPFGLSTMSGSKDVDYRDSAGTLGTTTKRPSNIEVNSPPKKEIPEEGADESNQASEDSFTQADIVNQPPTSASRRHKQESIYRWTDEEGVLHITNDLGTVPPKYQDQALRQSTAGQGVNR